MVITPHDSFVTNLPICFEKEAVVIVHVSPLHPLLAGIKSINLQRLCKMGVGSFTSKDKPATNIFNNIFNDYYPI